LLAELNIALIAGSFDASAKSKYPETMQLVLYNFEKCYRSTASRIIIDCRCV